MAFKSFPLNQVQESPVPIGVPRIEDARWSRDIC